MNHDDNDDDDNDVTSFKQSTLHVRVKQGVKTTQRILKTRIHNHYHNFRQQKNKQTNKQKAKLNEPINGKTKTFKSFSSSFFFLAFATTTSDQVW
jgi:hypothetical protein